MVVLSPVWDFFRLVVFFLCVTGFQSNQTAWRSYSPEASIGVEHVDFPTLHCCCPGFSVFCILHVRQRCVLILSYMYVHLCICMTCTRSINSILKFGDWYRATNTLNSSTRLKHLDAAGDFNLKIESRDTPPQASSGERSPAQAKRLTQEPRAAQPNSVLWVVAVQQQKKKKRRQRDYYGDRSDALGSASLAAASDRRASTSHADNFRRCRDGECQRDR